MIPRMMIFAMVLMVMGLGGQALAAEGPACGVETGASNPFSEAVIKGSEIINSSKHIIYALGTLAMLGIGIRAMYGGQMPWGWLFTVMAALVIATMVPAMCEWLYDGVIKPNKGVVNTYAGAANVIGDTGQQLFLDTREVLFGLGGVAAAALGIMGLFGKFPFRWLFVLTAGLAIITSAGAIVNYLTK
ncbi:MAG: hypothetical protein ACKO57_08725 [Alphaproteobacteria bacterium]